MSAASLGILAVVIAAAAAAIPAIRSALARGLERVRRPSPRQRALTAGAVFGVSILYLLLTAWEQGREFIPKFHDEFMHLAQMRMLASGRLWTAAHPLADFFESFHLLVRPVYASIYFPGTALLYLPAAWLGLPSWVMPLLAAGASAALLYRVLAELIDGAAGLLGAGLLLASSTFRFLSLVLMSHGAIILLGLTVAWTFLNLRRTRSPWWAAALGAAMGWAAITRPLDAIAYAMPVAIALLVTLRRPAAEPWRRWTLVAIIVAGAAPFIVLQLVQNVGVTGRLLQTPYQFYAAQDSPDLAIGFAATTRAAGESGLRTTLPQKRQFYDEFLRPQIDRHRLANAPRILLLERLPLVARATLPGAAPWLMVLWPLLFLAAERWRAALLWGMLPAYLLLYASFPFLLPHYAVVPAPAVLCGVLLGLRAIEHLLPGRLRSAAEVFLTLAVVGIALVSLPGIDRESLDDGRPRPVMWFAERVMPDVVQAPAIVLFRFAPGDNVHEEPVYNVDVVNPDDAPIIRAHDLGERNRALFDYYAKRQPQRSVYLFDRRSKTLVPLGNVVDLARRFPVTQPGR